MPNKINTNKLLIMTWLMLPIIAILSAIFILPFSIIGFLVIASVSTLIFTILTIYILYLIVKDPYGK